MGGQQTSQLGFPGAQVELPFAARNKSRKLTIGIVSTYPPRRCGIATFTKDLYDSLNLASDDCRVIIAAMEREEMDFGPEVVTTINPDNPADYRRAAKVFAEHRTDVVIVEHEFGIYGQKQRSSLDEIPGEYVLELAKGLTEMGIPYVPTLHTVLSEPSKGQRTVMKALCENAAMVTVFTHTAMRLLVDIGLADAEKLVIMPHGAASVIREGKKLLKDMTDKNPNCRVCKILNELDGRRVLSTFGLINSNKGIEVAIEALPDIVAANPDVCYLVAGATHPEVVRKEGESYRDSLTKMVRRLKMQDHVKFIDAFVTPEELAMLLSKTTLFVTPYHSRDQICSGALTFAVAAGCPTVSTPYYYAVDVLKDNRGKLVPFNDPRALASTINDLLGNKKQLKMMREQADKFGAQLPWPVVGRAMLRLLRTIPNGQKRRWHQPTDALIVPKIRLDHLIKMTKRGGIVQFSRRELPEYSSGYCVDDVSRLAIVAAWLERFGLAGEYTYEWLDHSLAILSQAYDSTTTMMYNMSNMKGRWLDRPHWGDHIGRTLWALGEVAAVQAVPEKTRKRATDLLEQASKSIVNLPGLRPAAEAAIGLSRLPKLSARQKDLLTFAANRLSVAYKQASDSSWRWFEDRLTYDNARLPQALILAGHALKDEALLNQGLAALDWLVAECDAIGNKCPYPRVSTVGNLWLSRERPEDGPGSGKGDEQPIEFTALVETLVDAYVITSRQKYAREALKTFDWFLGANRAYKWLYDPFTGGSQDGLLADGRLNPNMGAESTLAYYQALLCLAQAELVSIETVASEAKNSHNVLKHKRPLAA